MAPPTPGRIVPPPTPGRIIEEADDAEDDADGAALESSMPVLVSAPPSMPGSEAGDPCVDDFSDDDDAADDAQFFMPPSAALDGGPRDAKKLRLHDGISSPKRHLLDEGSHAAKKPRLDESLGHLGDASGSLLVGTSGADAADAGQQNQSRDTTKRQPNKINKSKRTKRRWCFDYGGLTCGAPYW